MGLISFTDNFEWPSEVFRVDWRKGKKPGTIVIHVQPSVRQMLDRLQEIGKSFKGRDLVGELIKMREEEDEF